MRSITLESCIIDDVNCVEVHICHIPPKNNSTECKSSIIDVSWNTSLDVSKILKNYLNFKNSTELVEYYHRDLCYTYDLANDGQRVTRKKIIKDTYGDASYAISFNEEVLPSHSYPCVKEQSNKTKIKRDTYRINNRLYIIHDTHLFSQEEYMYIRYNHSTNVDLKKNEADFQRAYKALIYI